MAVSKDVRLPNGRTPRWPDRCVLCGARGPRAVFQFKSTRVSWWSFLLVHWWPFGTRVIVRAPACPPCALTLRHRRFRREAIDWGVTAIVVAGVILVMAETGLMTGAFKPYRKWIAMGLCLVVGLPHFLYVATHPPKVGARTTRDETLYEFDNLDLAVEFAVLNKVTTVE